MSVEYIVVLDTVNESLKGLNSLILLIEEYFVVDQWLFVLMQ